jgi:gamma-carbonic anhydrase
MQSESDGGIVIRPFKGVYPKIDRTAFISETAVIIGDVHIGADTGVWFNVVIRGDVNSIRIGCRTNIQDLSMLHVTGKKSESNPGSPLFIGDDVTIGHNCTIHGCTLENGAFVGMNAVVMDKAVVGAGAMVAAGSLVTEGTIIQPGTLWVGSPARLKRALTEDEKIRATSIAASYIELAGVYRAPYTSVGLENNLP